MLAKTRVVDLPEAGVTVMSYLMGVLGIDWESISDHLEEQCVLFTAEHQPQVSLFFFF